MACVAAFAALGDETRLELIDRLAKHGPVTTLTLVKGLQMSRQAASKHLDVLESAGLITSEKVGREVIRKLNVDELSLANDWITVRAKRWENKLEKLKKLAEE